MHLRGKLGRLGVAALALATVAGGMVFASSPANAQAPSSVPSARFYGNARCPQGTCPSNLTITAFVGSTTCTGTQSIPQSQTNSGIDNGGNYVIDIQSVPGCTTPGGTVSFTAGAYRATETGTVPDIPGTAVHLNLTFQLPATPTRAATPVATPVVTPRPSTPAPSTPPPATAAAATVCNADGHAAGNAAGAEGSRGCASAQGRTGPNRAGWSSTGNGAASAEHRYRRSAQSAVQQQPHRLGTGRDRPGCSWCECNGNLRLPAQPVSRESQTRGLRGKRI